MADESKNEKVYPYWHYSKPFSQGILIKDANHETEVLNKKEDKKEDKKEAPKWGS